ncbi:MAG: hypothetical protein ABID38_03930 [Candidatus Diapherotrites archaeon]
METIIFLFSILLLLLTWSAGYGWIAGGILIIMVLSTRSAGTIIVFAIAMAAIYFLSESFSMQDLFIPLIFGLIVLFLIVGMGKKPEQPEYYSPDAGGYGNLLGGM